MSETIYELKSPVKDSRTGEVRWWRMCGRVVKKDSGQVAVYIDALPVNFDGFLAAMTPNPDYKRGESSSQAPERVQEGRIEHRPG